MSLKFKIFYFSFCTIFFAFQSLTLAQELSFKEGESIVKDISGDGKVIITAFGDSLTFGVGDGTKPGETIFKSDLPFTDGTLGYPKRLRELLGVVVDGEGFPGEQLTTDGVLRFPKSLIRTNGDIAVILEGTNDARQVFNPGDFQKAVQRVVNVAVALGREPVLSTLPKPCCDREFLRAETKLYSDTIRSTATINEIRLADIQRAWDSSCVNKVACELLNLPEGLHPNTKGYDVIAQTIASALLGIDIFKTGGAEQLAAATGLSIDKVEVKPDVTTATETTEK